MIFQDFGPTCLMFNVLLKDWFKELKRIYCEEFGQEYVKLSIDNLKILEPNILKQNM